MFSRAEVRAPEVSCGQRLTNLPTGQTGMSEPALLGLSFQRSRAELAVGSTVC